MSNELQEIIRISKALTKHKIINKKSIESIILKRVLDEKIDNFINKQKLTIINELT